MKKEQKKKIVKGIILSILLFAVVTIRYHILPSIADSGNPFGSVLLDFGVIIVPFIIVAFFFIKEKNFYELLILGAVIGFVSGNLFFCYLMITEIIAPTPSADYSLVPFVWIVFTPIFTGSGIIGSTLSYVIKKLFRKFKEKPNK